MDTFWSQLSSEWVHAAFAIFELVFGGVATVVWFYYRRSIKHNDENVAENKARLDEHEHRLSSHDRQIRDVRAAVEGPRALLKLGTFNYSE